MGFLGLATQKRVDELEKELDWFKKNLAKTKRELESSEFAKLFWKDAWAEKSVEFNRFKNNQAQVTKGIKGSEAEEAFEPFRKDIAKRIVGSPLTTENALIVARRAFITGYKKARQ